MLPLLIFILILSILVLIHEFGHFTAAKKSGVLVEEFGFGIPPRLIGKKIGETIYTLNALPFGGFVKLFGEDTEDGNDARTNPRSFLAKPAIVKAIILVAGVTMNLLLALVMYFVLFNITGYKSLNIPSFFDYKFKYGDVTLTHTVVSGFSEDSPAQRAGLYSGEAILTIDGQTVANLDEIKAVVGPKPGQEVTLLVKDMKKHLADSTREVKFVTLSSEEGKGQLGVYIAKSASIYYPNKLTAPIEHAANMLMYTYSTFGELISVAFETKSVEPVSSGVSGPVGIYSVVETILAYGGSDAVLGLIDLVGLLSLSLAFINILPLPALDGGRLVFVVVEGITGKPINQKFELALHKWGMLLLLGLLVLVTIKDVGQIIKF